MPRPGTQARLRGDGRGVIPPTGRAGLVERIRAAPKGVGRKRQASAADHINGGNNNGFGFGNTVTFVPPGGAAGTYTFVGSGRGGFDWFGTLRARVGVAFDRTLVYATGGFAFASGGDSNNNGLGFGLGCAGFAFGCGFNNDDDWRSGWTIGGGVEYAFTNNLTAKIEGLWVSLDGGNGNGVVAIPVAGNPNPPVRLNGNNNSDNEFFVARLGINYKFGW